MSSPPENSSRQPGQRLNVSRAAAQQTPLASPETGRDEKPGEDDARPMSSLMPQVNVHGSSLHDLMSARVWRNHVIWRAGVSVLKIERISVKQCFFPFLQVIEGIGSGSLNFITGLLVATLSTWPRAAVPVGILFGNAIIVSTIISAMGSATGALINPMVTIATAVSGHCHPVRAIIYIFCQIVGGVVGGALLRVALGKRLAYELHNGGCWIDPGGEVSVWQAALIEFVSTFILLFVILLFIRFDFVH